MQIKCVVCGKVTTGRLPRASRHDSGDGSVWFPRRHKFDGKDCPGNIEEGEDIKAYRTVNPLSLAPSQLEELISKLTPRQMQIIELLAFGHGVGDTSTILSIHRDTVQRHIHRACEKTEVSNRVQLIVLFAMWRAVQNGETL